MTLKKILILCAHEPHLDPRIKWVHHSLKKKYHAEVVGISGNGGKEENFVQTIPLSQEGRGAFLKKISKKIWLNKDVKKSIAIFFLAVAVIPFLIFIMLKMVFFLLDTIFEKLNIEKNRLQKSIYFFYRFAIFRDFYDFFTLLRGLFYSNLTFLNFLKSDPTKTDVIYANDFDTLIAAVLFKEAHDVKIIYDCHEFWPHSHASFFFFPIKFFSFLENIFIQEVDETITVNPLLAKEISRSYNKKVGYIYNAAPLQTSNIKKTDFYALLLKEFDGKVLFLFQGAFAPYRGLEELCFEWEKFSTEQGGGILFLRGPLGEGYAKQFKEKCKTLICNEKTLFFLDAVPEDDLIDAARGFDVGIVPYEPIDLNYRYCCPNKLSQYMQSGLGIMANNTEFLKEFVRSNEVGEIYDSRTPLSTISTFQRFTEDPIFLKKCKENALKCVKKFYNWENQEQKLYSLIEGDGHKR